MANYAQNRKVYFNYEILEKYECGIELLGTEVKSIRNGQISLEAAFVISRGGEAFLINANIPPYQVKMHQKTMTRFAIENFCLLKKNLMN